jgi:predicted MFS family arabinose efflux permease
VRGDGLNAGTGLNGPARLLYLGPFVSMLDRFSIAPLLIPIAHDFRAPLAQATLAATSYYALYGAMQVAYGLVSDRVGRVRLMRVASVGVAAAGLVSMLAPNLVVLVVGRAATGALIAAIFPATLVYVGDTFPFQVRQRAVADLLAAAAVGTAAATFWAGLIAHYASWRLAFLLPAVLSLGLAYALRWLPESLVRARRIGALAQLQRLAVQPWMVFMVAMAIVEGAAILGFSTFFASALEAHGVNPAIAGLVVATYGVAVLAGTRAAKRLAGRTRPHLLILAGGASLVAAYVVAALAQRVGAILTASVLVGGAYAVMHSTIQTWATEVAPGARGTSTALFAAAAFIGAALGAGGLAGLAEARAYTALFWIAAAVTAPMVVIWAAGRSRFPEVAGDGGAAS